MNESIVVAQVRKDTTVKVPAGGWVILCDPSQPFTDANKAFDAQSSPVSENFSRIVIGRIRHERPARNPLSQSQLDAKVKSDAEQAERVKKTVEDSQKRDAEYKAKRQEEYNRAHADQRKIHDERIEKIRKETGYYDKPSPAPVMTSK